MFISLIRDPCEWTTPKVQLRGKQRPAWKYMMRLAQASSPGSNGAPDAGEEEDARESPSGTGASQQSLRPAPIKQGYGRAPIRIRTHKAVKWPADMNELVQRLGYLPLALVQAGMYMRETKTGCSKYLDLSEASWSQLAAETPRLRDYENGSIPTT